MRSRTLTLLALLVDATTASYAFYVGKALTEDGSVMVGGTGEEVSSHWLEIFLPKTILLMRPLKSVLQKMRPCQVND